MVSNLPQPLHLLETLRIIFAFLDNKALVACAQVNRLWADEATDILWQQPPTLALLSLVSSGRAPIYANKITSLLLWRETMGIDPLQAFQHLLFPRLREINASSIDLVGMQQLLPYLQPTLQRLSISVSPPPKSPLNDEYSSMINEAFDAVLMQLSASCPFLQEIALQSLALNRDELFDLLKRASSLRSVALIDGSEIEYKTIRNLAALSNLARLCIDSVVPGEYIALLEAESFPPFANLQHLRIYVEEDAIFNFLSRLRKLKILKLSLLHPSTALLSSLSRCSGLRELQVHFNAPGSVIKALDLIFLAASCRNLTVLALSGLRYYNDSDRPFRPGILDGSDIKDFDIRTFSSLLPNLKVLALDCWGKLSVLSLHHLGRNCPRLQHCDLVGCQVEIFAFLDYSPLDLTRASAASFSLPNAFSRVFVTHDPRSADLKKSLAVMQDSEGPQLAKGEESEDFRPLFPKLKYLAVRDVLNCKNFPAAFVKSCLFSGAPRLKGIRFENQDTQFAQHMDEELLYLRRL